MNKLIVNYTTREKRFALIQNNKVVKLVVKQPKHQSLVGNIYLGTVTKVLPGMNAAFVNIGNDKNGFIYRNKLASFVLSSEENSQKEKRSISCFVHQGEKILVQVEKDATGTKGPRLNGVIELTGNNIIYMPEGRYVAVSKKIENPTTREKWREFGLNEKVNEEGIIFRTSCESASDQDIRTELSKLRQLFNQLNKMTNSFKKPGILLEQDHFVNEMVQCIKMSPEHTEIIVDDRQVFEKLSEQVPTSPIQLYQNKQSIFSAFHLDGELEKALKRIVWLENGAYIIIDEVEALTIMDVNTGKFSGKQNLADTVLKTNLLAAEEAARQICLRDLGGMILVDFIDMKTDGERQKVIERMRLEFQKDERRTNIVGFTQLGILQLTRKKTKVSLSESLMEKCQVCDGTGRIPSAETMAFRLERELYEYRNSDIEEVVIELSDDVRQFFCGENNVHFSRIQDTVGFMLTFENSFEKNQPFYHISKIR